MEEEGGVLHVDEFKRLIKNPLFQQQQQLQQLWILPLCITTTQCYKMVQRFLSGSLWDQLIPKSSNTTMAKNFRPITCLNVMYKLWTACLTELLMAHCAVNDVLHPAQKGCARNQLGRTDHLLLNNRIWHLVKSRNQSLSVAWLDYRKAYDSVLHNWVLCCLRLFHFHPIFSVLSISCHYGTPPYTLICQMQLQKSWHILLSTVEYFRVTH